MTIISRAFLRTKIRPIMVAGLLMVPMASVVIPCPDAVAQTTPAPTPTPPTAPPGYKIVYLPGPDGTLKPVGIPENWEVVYDPQTGKFTIQPPDEPTVTPTPPGPTVTPTPPGPTVTPTTTNPNPNPNPTPTVEATKKPKSKKEKLQELLAKGISLLEALKILFKIF